MGVVEEVWLWRTKMWSFSDPPASKKGRKLITGFAFWTENILEWFVISMIILQFKIMFTNFEWYTKYVTLHIWMFSEWGKKSIRWFIWKITMFRVQTRCFSNFFKAHLFFWRTWIPAFLQIKKVTRKLCYAYRFNIFLVSPALR